MIEVISLHIPKTGGRSLHGIYKQIYGNALDLRNERDQFYPDKEFLMPLNLEFPEHIRGIHAHLTVEQVRPIIEKYNPKVITWLRDPVERVISNYYFFMKRIRSGRAPERQLRKKDVTLLEYARKPRKTNRISEFLKGMELEDFFFIGLLERYEEAIAVLKNVLNRDPTYLNSRLNLIITYIMSGKVELARKEAIQVLKLSPDFSIGRFLVRFPYKDKKILDGISNCLRKAGLPD